MARSSGPAGAGAFRESFAKASFLDPHSSIRYSVTPDFGVKFERGALAGERPLRWYIGSGSVGRSYVTAVGDFLFQAPVSYYSAAGKWDLSPGFADRANPGFSRPIEEPCLLCHATMPRLVAETQNRYADPPFLEAGIGCESCHGPGSGHLAAVRSGAADRAIVNPVRLAADRRDAVCEQCHLTGAARVVKAGGTLSSFQPGDRLSDIVSVFVWSPPANRERAATDHAEQLSQSECKRAAGARLWCGSCHDPHTNPSPRDGKAACGGCHTAAACAEKPPARAAVSDQCSACHMPKRRSREGEHVAFTDHTIRRRPAAAAATGSSQLRPYWPKSSERDFALAFASLGMEDASLRPRALMLLQKAASANPSDVPLLVQLAQYYDGLGRGSEAAALYRRALAAEPGNALASANLAIYLMREGKTEQAIAMWKDVFNRYPALIGPALNLEAAQRQTGDTAGAEATERRIRSFHPLRP